MIMMKVCKLGSYSIKAVTSHASATATYKQSRPKQGEGKDQANDTYK